MRIRKHALDRINGRTSLSPQDVVAILSHGITVPIGIEKSSNRLHKLFYSEADEDYFVAIVDQHNDDIITVLPYHYDCRSKVSSSALTLLQYELRKKEDEVCDVVDGDNIEAQIPINQISDVCPEAVFQKQTVQNFIFSVFVRSECNKTRKISVKLPYQEFPFEIGELHRNSRVHKRLNDLLFGQLTDKEYIDFITVRLGQKGDPEGFELISP